MSLPINITDLLVKSENEEVDLNFFNRRFTALMSALTNLDGRMAVYDAQVSNLVTLGLQRMNDAMGPMLTTLSEAAGLGFLVCKADGTSHSLTLGEAIGWNITSGADIFTPTPYLMVQDDNDSTNWGIVSVDTGGWVQSAATLATHVVYTSKTLASTQWTISANAAFIPAMQTMLTDTQSARDAAQAADADATTQAASVAAGVAAIEAGPVSSVAGKTGIVTLVEGDIGNLVSDLANRATTSQLNSSVSGLQPSSANLAALASLALAANKLLMATGAGGLTQITVTSQAQTLLADAAAADMRSTLGLGSTSTLDVGTGANNVVQLDSSGRIPSVPSFAGGINAQGGSYTLTATDTGKIVRLTSASAVTLTVPAGLPANFACMIEQGGAGQVTITGSGATVNSRGSRNKIVGQYGVAALWYTASNVFTLSGDTTA